MALTALNIILLVSGSYTYFLFSASIPYFIADIGMLLCGKYPPETYVEEFESMAIFDGSAVAIFIIIALLAVSVYLLCWFFSKKNGGWLVAALVLFALDTVAMLFLYGIALDSIVDIALHGYVIWSLVSGVRAHNALVLLPPVFTPTEQGGDYVTEDFAEKPESSPEESGNADTASDGEASAEPSAAEEEKYEAEEVPTEESTEV